MLADALKVLSENIQDNAFGVFYTAEEQASFRGRFPKNDIIPLGAGLGDVSRLERLLGACREFQPDWLIHCAAWTDVDGCELDPKRSWEANAMSTLEVAMVARELGTRLMVISTDFVFDGESSRPYLESDQPNPISNYGRAKFAGERLAELVAAERVLVVRTAWLYGRYGKNFVDTIRQRLLAGDPVRVVNDQTGCPTYVEDLAIGLRVLAERQASGIYHVTNSGSATWFELANEVALQVGRQGAVTPITSEELGRPARRPKFSVLDCSKYHALVGSSLPDWRQALQRYLHS